MIKTLDLRIGNFITVSEDIYRVTGISETKVRCKGYKGSFTQEAIQPIGLTHEILQKAGFKQRGISDLYYKVPEEGFIYNLASNRVMIFHAGENTLYHSLYTYMPSLHQLQNFYYCLTGREIAIRLQ